MEISNTTPNHIDIYYMTRTDDKIEFDADICMVN